MVRTVGNIFFVLFILTLSACQSNTCVQRNNQHNETKVFFTPGTDCEKNIIANINKAQKMDIAVYSITHPDITQALINAHNRGAKIRIVTDRMMAKNKGSLVERLRASGIPVLTNKKHKIEHNKFAVFDNVYIVSGSYNWTTNASKYNSENCVFFDQPDKEFSSRFEYLWNLYTSR